LLNQLLGEERAIVSDIPGTTRDAIDTALEWQGQAVRLVDTAGLRRRGKIAQGPAAERYSALRSLKAIGRADVCVLVLDARDGLAAQDAHVAGYVVDEGVGLVLAINKWDLVEKDDKTFEAYVERVRGEAPFLHFAPVVAISALTGQRAGRVLDEALAVAVERRRRISTGRLNKVLSDAVARHQPPAVKGRRPRFYYATQASIEPPTFVLFASEAKSVHFSYQRFLENRIRDAFAFEGTPLRLIFRERSKVNLEPRKRKPATKAKGKAKPTKKSRRKGS
jgi:GTP-binding protein